MKNKTFRKDTVRSIKGSFSRFVAIFAIVALGAGFYAGLCATAPDMRATIEQYCDDSGMMDIELLSTFGFTEEDIGVIRAADGIEAVMAGYRTDALSDIDGKEQVIRIHSLPENTDRDNADYLNRPVLVEGRMPQNSHECLLGVSKMDGSVKIGSTILLKDKDGKLSDTLQCDEFTIVGLVDSAYYLSFTLGSSAIGSGTISHFMYVTDTAFSTEVYTDVHATVRGAAALFSFSEAYDDLVDPVIDTLETVADNREQARYDEIRSDALAEIADAQAELDDARAQADEELADAYNELNANAQKLRDAETQIADNTAKLNSAEAQLNANAAGLASLKTQYDAYSAQYAAGLPAYQTSLADYQQKDAAWQQGNTAYQASLSGYQALYDGYLSAGVPEADIPSQLVDPTGSDPAIPAGLTMGQLKAQLDQTQTDLADSRRQLDTYKTGLDQSKADLDALAGALSTMKAKLDEADAAKQQIASGRAALESAKNELATAQTKLADGWAEYNDAKADAEAELTDAQTKIDDAKTELDDLEMPEWYVLSRHTNVGYASFTADADRMTSLSTVFPVLFFLVAALVALTTMTRMVEEERVIIGTYKALGYSNGSIISKYLLYAFLASIFGAAVGVCIGFVTLPVVCYNSYRLLYTAPDLIVQFNWKYAIEGTLASLLCTLGSTYAACRSSLRESTASLLQPKAPKAGKRILLERMTFLWKHLSFTRKVTCRNMFRYKKRLIMTLVGIAGCTGLLVTGFGIKNSISDVMHKQYDELYAYDTVLTVDDGALTAETEVLLDDTDYFSGYQLHAQKAAELSANGETVQGYTLVPDGALSDFVNLRDRRTHAAVEFGENSVVITEKAAKQLGVGVGDSVSIKNANEKNVSFTITGIAENYIYHYLYIAPGLYAEKMGEAPEYNTVAAKCILADETGRDALMAKLLDCDGVATGTYTEDSSASFDDMIRSLDYIVLVIIVCAGALAFVVVYNLTNINITERRRELATIKVLGFRRKEVCDYIFRETNMLTVLGSLIGLAAGKIMHAFVITTVEVDIVMFGRDIAWWSYLVSFALTCAFSFIVNLFMRRRIDAVDMVESLKSVD